MQSKFSGVAFILFFVLTSMTAHSQDYMDEIGQKSCECLEDISDSLDQDQFNMELGLCMINASLPYKKLLKKDYDIDLDRIETEGEKLGKTIAIKMISFCPKLFTKLTNRNEPNDSEFEELSITGTITNIHSDLFISFSIKDELGMVKKFFWMPFIETNIDLPQSYEQLEGKEVQINYLSREYYDPKIGEYRQFFIISKLFIQ